MIRVKDKAQEIASVRVVGSCLEVRPPEFNFFRANDAAVTVGFDAENCWEGLCREYRRLARSEHRLLAGALHCQAPASGAEGGVENLRQVPPG